MVNPNKSPSTNKRVDFVPSTALREDNLKKELVRTLKAIAVIRNRYEGERFIVI